MKVSVLVAFVALSLGVSMAGANADPQRYRAPAHNYYQNNWMNAGG
jgi:hypothetical protein